MLLAGRHWLMHGLRGHQPAPDVVNGFATGSICWRSQLCHEICADLANRKAKQQFTNLPILFPRVCSGVSYLSPDPVLPSSTSAPVLQINMLRGAITAMSLGNMFITLKTNCCCAAGTAALAVGSTLTLQIRLEPCKFGLSTDTTDQYPIFQTTTHMHISILSKH